MAAGFGDDVNDRSVRGGILSGLEGAFGIDTTAALVQRWWFLGFFASENGTGVATLPSLTASGAGDIGESGTAVAALPAIAGAAVGQFSIWHETPSADPSSSWTDRPSSDPASSWSDRPSSDPVTTWVDRGD